MSCFPISLVRVLERLFPRDPVQWVDPSFPQLLPQTRTARTELGKSTCAALRHLLCSHRAGTAQSPATEDIWARQPGAQQGASRWETANISLNPPFLLRSPMPTATVKLLFITPLCLTHFSPNSSIWDGLKTGKKRGGKLLLEKPTLFWFSPLFFPLSFLSSSTSLLYLPFVSLCKKRNQVRKKERWRTLI